MKTAVDFITLKAFLLNKSLVSGVRAQVAMTKSDCFSRFSNDSYLAPFSPKRLKFVECKKNGSWFFLYFVRLICSCQSKETVLLQRVRAFSGLSVQFYPGQRFLKQILEYCRIFSLICLNTYPLWIHLERDRTSTEGPRSPTLP